MKDNTKKCKTIHERINNKTYSLQYNLQLKLPEIVKIWHKSLYQQHQHFSKSPFPSLRFPPLQDLPISPFGVFSPVQSSKRMFLKPIILDVKGKLS